MKMKKRYSAGAVAPAKIDADGWNAIVNALGRPLMENGCGETESEIIKRSYEEQCASKHIPSDVITGVVLPGIRSVDGQMLELQLQSLAVEDYQFGVPEDQVKWQVVMTPVLISENRKEVR